MNAASIATGVACGAASRRISVTEKFAAPLLLVASSCSSGDIARPNGFGAPTQAPTPLVGADRQADWPGRAHRDLDAGRRDEAPVRQDRGGAPVDRRRDRRRPIACR